MNQAMMMGPFGAMQGAMHGAASCQMGAGACSHGAALGAALMAVTAALGWWVLSKAEKDGGPRRVLWAGRVVGWLLLAGGLSGFLCATLSHAGKRACSAPAMGPQGGALPPGHPPIPK